jgi:hypothetical protein
MLIFCKFCFCLVDSENIVCQKRYDPHKKYSCCINGKPECILIEKKNVKSSHRVKKKSIATQTIPDNQLYENNLVQVQEFNNNIKFYCDLLLGLSKPTISTS